MTTILVILSCVLVVGVLAMFYEMRKLRKAGTTTDKDKVLMEWLKEMRESQSETSKSIRDQMHKQNERLDQAAIAIGKVLKMGESTEELLQAFRAPKTRGTKGEEIMQDLLSQHLPSQSYGLQHAFKSGEKVDAVIKIKNGLIPIDAKFPLEKYQQAHKAKEEDRKRLLKEFHKHVKKHIDDIARKYIVPAEHTLDFAVMYVPARGVYEEIVDVPALMSHAGAKNVHIVEPRSFYYFLRTVLLALKNEQMGEKAKDIIRLLQAVQTDSGKLGDDLGVLGKHLSNAKGMYESVDKRHAKLTTKLEQASKLPGTVDRDRVKSSLETLSDRSGQPEEAVTTKQ